MLDLYQLPSLNELKLKQKTKELWKTTVKEAVNNYWTESLTSEVLEKSTLRFLDIDSMKIGQTHPVWDSLETVVSDVWKGIIKCRMLTGTYLLQSISHKFSRASVSATCKFCGLNDEDLAHMLFECPSLIHQRKPLYSGIKSQVINCIGVHNWRELFNNRNNLGKLFLDCSSYRIIKEKTEYQTILNATTDLCYRLHVRSRVVSALSRFGPESFRSWVFSARVVSAWVVSAKFGGSFRPDFFKVPWGKV